MDAEKLESEALGAISGAGTLDELDDARVRYLGRKSELKQALRGSRAAHGRRLNQLRELLETAVEERRDALGLALER
jgi:hypothetical protein